MGLPEFNKALLIFGYLLHVHIISKYDQSYKDYAKEKWDFPKTAMLYKCLVHTNTIMLFLQKNLVLIDFWIPNHGPLVLVQIV